MTDDETHIGQAIQIQIFFKAEYADQVDRVMERVTREIEEAFCGPEINDDHECALYAIGWHSEKLGEDGLTPSERELEAYREAWVERFGPMDKLMLERFGVVSDASRYVRGQK